MKFCKSGIMVVLSTLAMACALICRCSSDPVAGTTSQEGNARVISGRISDMSGVRYGIPITLLPEDFNPLMEVVPDSLRDTTNEEGRFRFRVSEGVYTLSARVAVDTFVYRGDLATEDSLYVEDSVRAGGAIQLSIPDSIAELLVSCYVRGTPFTWPVSSGGSVLLKNVPAGTVSIRCYSSSAGEIEELARDGIVVTPNRTTPVR